MKQIIFLIAIILILGSNIPADSAAPQAVDGTVVAQQQMQTGEDSWGNQKGNDDGEAFVRDYSSKLPLKNTTFVLHEETGAVTNHQIIDTTPYCNIYVVKYSIISMDITNKGVFKMCFDAAGSDPFTKGYIGTAPCGMGDDLYIHKSADGVWITVPGACVITIQYSLTAP